MGVELIRLTEALGGQALGVAVTMKGGEREGAELLGPRHLPPHHFLSLEGGWKEGGAVRKFYSLEKLSHRSSRQRNRRQ